MRLLLLLLLFIPFIGFSQSGPTYGAAVGYVNGVPTYTPNIAQKASELCVSINRKMLYLWNRDSSEWKPLGGITVSFGAPISAPAAVGGTRTTIDLQTGLTYWWNGTAWKEVIAYSVELASVYAANVAELNADEVRAELADTSAALRANLIDSLARSGWVGNTDLSNGAVTWMKLAQAVKDSIAAGGSGGGAPSGPAGGVLTGTYPDPGLGPNTVGNTQVINKSLDSTDIKNRGLALLQLNQSGATNGQVPKFNTTTGNWEPGTVSGGGVSTLLPKYVPLFVFMGESNSRGYAQNSDASAPELAPRPNTRILNVTTRLFETLDVGTNNMGFDATSHGWELELANQAVTNPIFKSDSIYIVKTGQGGSTISQWLPQTTPFYFDTAISRIKTAIGLLKAQGKQPQVFILYSQGINDAISNTNPNTWASNTIALINNVRKEIGNAIVLTPNLIGTDSDIPGLKTAMNTYFINRANGVYFIPSPQGAVGDSLRDANHWSYLGIKAIAQRMVKTIDTIGLDFEYLRKSQWTKQENFNLSPFTFGHTALFSQPVLTVQSAAGWQGLQIKTGASDNTLTIGYKNYTASLGGLTHGFDTGVGGLYNNSVNGLVFVGASGNAVKFYNQAVPSLLMSVDYYNNLTLHSLAAGSSGGSPTYGIHINRTYNFTGTNSAPIWGVYYNPIVTATNGNQERAWENTRGDMVLNSGSGNTIIGGSTPAAKLHVVGEAIVTSTLWLNAAKTVGVFSGTGSPEGAVTASPGSTYRNTSGGTGTTFYTKITGTGNTGWAALGVATNLGYTTDAVTGTVTNSNGTAATLPAATDLIAGLLTASDYVALQAAKLVRNGVASGTTDGSGDLVITFSSALPNSTYSLVLTPEGTTSMEYSVTAKTTTTATVRFYGSTTGLALPTTAVAVSYHAKDY